MRLRAKDPITTERHCFQEELPPRGIAFKKSYPLYLWCFFTLQDWIFLGFFRAQAPCMPIQATSFCLQATKCSLLYFLHAGSITPTPPKTVQARHVSSSHQQSTMRMGCDCSATARRRECRAATQKQSCPVLQCHNANLARLASRTGVWCIPVYKTWVLLSRMHLFQPLTPAASYSPIISSSPSPPGPNQCTIPSPSPSALPITSMGM